MRYVEMSAELEKEFRETPFILESSPGKYYDVSTLQPVEIEDK
jgi:hypothetical protein